MGLLFRLANIAASTGTLNFTSSSVRFQCNDPPACSAENANCTSPTRWQSPIVTLDGPPLVCRSVSNLTTSSRSQSRVPSQCRHIMFQDCVY